MAYSCNLTPKQKSEVPRQGDTTPSFVTMYRTGNKLNKLQTKQLSFTCKWQLKLQQERRKSIQ